MTAATLEVMEANLAAALRLRKYRSLYSTERKLARLLRAAFRAESRAFLARMDSSRRKATVTEAELPEWWEWEAALAAAMQSSEVLFRAPVETAAAVALGHGAAAAAADLVISIAFDLANPRATAYLATAGADLIANIRATTRDRVRAIITKAAAEGWSYEQAAREIRKLYIGFTTPTPQAHIRDRAQLIAVTELGNAYEAGNNQQARDLKALGIAVEKSWLTVGDARVDLPHCRLNESAGWVELEQLFPSGHDIPLAHPGCRCTTLYRRVEDGGNT